MRTREFVTRTLSMFLNLRLASDGSIQVNSMLQVTPDVYAAGDAASVFCSESRQFQRTEHWNVAVGHGLSRLHLVCISVFVDYASIRTGRTIARNIVENATVAYQEVPFFWTVC